MTKEEFDRRVTKHSAAIERNPGAYKFRVLAFALVGYFVYGLMMLATLGLLVGIVAIAIWHPSAWVLKLGFKAIIPVGLLIFAMFASLKVGAYVPEGIRLTEQLSPRLFKEIDKVRGALEVPPLSSVVLTDDFNASVVQNPRWGFFGSQNTLILGMPLMQSVSPQDLSVVLAHEFGHLSGNHSRFSGWVYRAVRTYAQLLQSTGGSAVVEGFLNWYVPRLDALSFPLRRQNEYEADAAAGEIHGKQQAAQALANVEVRANRLSDFWKGIFEGVVNDAHPPAALFHDWAKQVREQPKTDAQAALKEQLEVETGTEDTHPSLSDRVGALECKVEVEEFSGPSAAEEFLGEEYESLVQQAGYFWSSAVAPSWQERHAHFATKRTELAALEDQRQTRALTPDEAFRYADLFEDVCPDQDALPYFQAAHDLNPDHEATRFALGRLLVERDDNQGQALLEPFTSHADPELQMASASLLSRYHRRNDNEATAEEVLKKGQAAAEVHAERQRELNELSSNDTFAPHGLSKEQLDRLTMDLAVTHEIKRAYLVRRVVEHAEDPIYVLAFDTRIMTDTEADEDELAEMSLREKVTYLGEVWFVPLSENGAFKKPLRAIVGSEIYAL